MAAARCCRRAASSAASGCPSRRPVASRPPRSLLFAYAIPPGPSGLEVFARGIETAARTAAPMTARAERIAPEQRLRTSQDYATVKRDGRALKGRHCMLLAAVTDGVTRVGFI